MTETRRRDVTATRSVLRELRAEQRVAREGREFLDQKRVLLATEILRQMRSLAELRAALQRLQDEATEALARAVARHGLEGLWCQHPGADPPAPQITRRRFIGVDLVEATLPDTPSPPSIPEVQPSPEARLCRHRFRDLLPLFVQIAAISSNLERLGREYRQTDRRVRALERVLMPEIDATARAVEEELDEQEQEEAIYARLPRPAREG